MLDAHAFNGYFDPQHHIGLGDTLSAGGLVVKAYFCRHAPTNDARPFRIAHSFRKFDGAFNQIHDLCQELEFHPELYVLASLHALPEDFCMKTFGRPYPMPSMLLVSQKKALDRYEKFLKFVNQHKTPVRPIADEEEDIQNSLYVWSALGAPRDLNKVKQMLELHLISQAAYEHILIHL